MSETIQLSDEAKKQIESIALEAFQTALASAVDSLCCLQHYGTLEMCKKISDAEAECKKKFSE